MSEERDRTIVIRITTGLGQMDLFDVAVALAEELQERIENQHDAVCHDVHAGDVIVTDKEIELYVTPRRKAS